MADEIKREVRDAQSQRATRWGPRTTMRARLLAAAILTMALVGALVPLSALGASGSGAVTSQQTATATRGTATVVGTVVGTAPRTATAVATVTRTVAPSPTVAATATTPPTAVAAPATATTAVPGMPRTGGGGTLWGIEVAWLTVAAFVLLALAGAAVATSRRRAS